MPIQKTELYVRQYTDTDLRILLEAIQDEIQRRGEQRKKARSQWIARQLASFQTNQGHYQRVGDTIIVSALYYGKVVMSKTTPTKNDKFDLNTGIAVAYAKAIGLRVPDFI